MTLASFGAKAKQVLATVAPLLGTAIGGPLGTAAGALVSAALGTQPGDSTAAETALLSASPDTLLKLRQAEEAFTVQMKSLGIQEEQLSYADTASARTMQMTIKSTTPTVLSYGVLTASMAAFLGIVAGYVHIPTDPQTALIYGSVLTFMFTESKSVLGYWFGSSIGSANKDATIANIANTP
jgi:hypothetical protein